MSFEFYHEHKTGNGLSFYDSWAFSENASEMHKANMKALAEYDGRYVQPKPGQSARECAEENPNKLVYYNDGTFYGRNSFYVQSNPENLSAAEIALIVDRGNLCFGYTGSNFRINIYTD